MFKLLSSFETEISKLKSPTSKDSDPALWQSALDQCPAAGEPEKRLVNFARWVGIQAELGRAALRTTNLSVFNAEWQTVLAIAVLNREYRTGDELIREELRAGHTNKGAILDDLGGLTITGATGTPVGAADITETSVDSVESWLFDALNAAGKVPEEEEDITAAASEAIRSYSWRKSLNVLWNLARYHGHFLGAGGEDLRLLPRDLAFERLLAACSARQEANLLNFNMIDQQVWITMRPVDRRKMAMTKSVIGARRINGRLQLKVGLLPYLSKNLPAYVAEKGSLEGSYLAEFLNTAMPVDNRLSASLFLRAWHVIRDAAEALTRLAPIPDKFTPEIAWDAALVIERSELSKALMAALRMELDLADAVLDFLTYGSKATGAKGHKGLWSAPIVPIPNTNVVALPLPALITSNPLRKVEAWLEKGGIDDTNPIIARGERYEKFYRGVLCAAIRANSLFKTAKCLEHALKPTAKFSEEIDLLFCFGGLAVVGELKFFLTPADPHERYRYFGKLEKAAEQASRKAEAIKQNREVLAAALKIDTSEAEALEVLPVVVVNQGYGMSLEIGGVRIVDAYFLRLFMSGDGMITSMAASNRSATSAHVSQTYYSSEMAARRNFELEIADPFVLRRFLDRVKFRYLDFPSLAGPTLHVAAAYLGKMDGIERINAEALMATIDRSA